MNNVKFSVLKEAGYKEAILGLSLSYNSSLERVEEVAKSLSSKDNGHNKFLESIAVWLDISAPRYWWQQFDTYRIGVTKQSESTIHTLLKTPLSQANFSCTVDSIIIDIINNAIASKDLEKAKSYLPEAFIQRRIVTTNYKALRNIYLQRKNHKLQLWKSFCDFILREIERPYLIAG